MPDYIAPPIITEPDDLSNVAFDYLEAHIPGWSAAAGNLETWLTEAIAQMASELAYVESAVPTAIFRYLGESLHGIYPQDATTATGTTTWTATDALGYTIAQGTTIGIPASGDELLGFEVTQDYVIAPGQTSVSGVIVIAQDAGSDGNNLTGACEVVDALDWVASVTLDAATSGGVDAESDEDYLARLRGLYQILAPRPILPNDFAVLAMQVPGIGGATAIDLYNPGPPVATNVPRCVTVVVWDEAGNPAPAGTASPPYGKAGVDATLQAQREVNFLVFVIDPTYTTINVTFTIKAYPDYDGPTIASAAVQAVKDYLSPANFGLTPYGDSPQYLPDDKVRYLEVAEAINRTEGVWYIGTLTVNGGTADVTLAGPGPMPKAGTVTGTAL